MLQIYLFGHLHIQINGVPRKFNAPPKTIPLWAYLLLNRSTPVSRNTLAYTLWPDKSEETARANFRRHLHQLQRTLPESPFDRPWLTIDAETIQWNPQADAWLDVAEFERLSADENTLASAVRIYANDLLEDVDEDWLFFERERLRNLFFNDLNQLIQQCRERGDFAPAIAYADRILVHDPLREDTVRQVMALQYESGNRAGALAEYARFERSLRQKLNVEPMPETIAHYETILRNAPLPETASSDAGERLEANQLIGLPFVGRQSELSSLNEYWTRTTHQKGGVILMSGENGIGKSRLSAKIAQTAEASGGRVLRGSTTFAEPLPYQAFAEILRSALPFLETMSIDLTLLSAITPLVPELNIRRQNLPALVSLKPDEVQNHLFESIARCLEFLALPRPLLVILENMHWAGRLSLLLLEYLARRIPGNPILIIVTYRDEDKHHRSPLQLMRSRLQREGLVNHIALKPLRQDEIREALDQIWEAGTVQSELVERLYKFSQGNPLFLREILRDWLASRTDELGAVQKQDAETGNELPGLPYKPIPSIQATISRRLAGLNSTTRALAEIGAVIGPAFDLDLIRKISGWNEALIIEAIDELMDEHLLHETGTKSGYDFEFSHPLVQATLYHAIPASILKYRHHRVAHILQALYHNQPAHLIGQLAYHFEAAGEAQSAAKFYLRMIQQDLSLQNPGHLLELTDHALGLDCTPRTRFRLLAVQEAILSKQEDQHKHRLCLGELKRLAFSIQDQDLICESLQREILFDHATRRIPDEFRSVSLMRSHAASSKNPYWQAVAFQRNAFLKLQLGQLQGTCDEFDIALKLFRSLNKTEEQAICFCGLALAAILEERIDDVPALLDQARFLSLNQTSPTLKATILKTACQAEIKSGNFPNALALGKRALEIYRSNQERCEEANMLASLAKISIELDRSEKAQEYMDQAGLIYTLLEDRSGKAQTQMIAAELAIHHGKISEAFRAYQDAEGVFGELKDLQMQAKCSFRLSEILIDQNRYEESFLAAKRTLKLAHKLLDHSLETAALTILARCARISGKISQSLKYLLASLNLEENQYPRSIRLIALGELAITYLELQESYKAQQAIETMLKETRQTQHSAKESERLLWTAAVVYHSLGNFEKGRHLLSQAVAMANKRLATLLEPDSRSAYLKNSIVRQIFAASQQNQWPETIR